MQTSDCHSLYVLTKCEKLWSFKISSFISQTLTFLNFAFLYLFNSKMGFLKSVFVKIIVALDTGNSFVRPNRIHRNLRPIRPLSYLITLIFRRRGSRSGLVHSTYRKCVDCSFIIPQLGELRVGSSEDAAKRLKRPRTPPTKSIPTLYLSIYL